jgi:hypothetical protein
MKKLLLITIAIMLCGCVAHADSGSSSGASSDTLADVASRGATATVPIEAAGLSITAAGQPLTFNASETVKLLETVTQPDKLTSLAPIYISPSGGVAGTARALDINANTSANAAYIKQAGSSSTLGLENASAFYALDAFNTSTGLAGRFSGTGDGPGIQVQTNSISAAKYIIDAHALKYGFTSYVFKSSIDKSDGAAAGNHAQWSTGISGVDTPVAVMSKYGGLALGTNVSYSNLGNIASSTIAVGLFASGSISTNGNIAASGTLTMGGLSTFSSGLTFDTASDTLDFYDEGTWTPAYDGVTAGDCATGTTATGTYTVIGNVVHATIMVTVTGCAVTPTGGSYVTLPVAPSSTLAGACSIGYISDYALSANNIMTSTIYTISAMRFWQTPVGGGAATLAPADTAWTGYFHCTYLTD